MTDQQIDEFLEMLAKSPTSARDMVRGLFAANEAKAAPASTQDEPFGYFRVDALGWTDCAATDEGAIALYERPAAPAVPNVLKRGYGRLIQAAADLALQQFMPSDIVDDYPSKTISAAKVAKMMTQPRDRLRLLSIEVSEGAKQMLAATPATPSQEHAVNLSCRSTQARLAAQWGYVPAPSQPAVPQGWTDADSDAARLALELECLLLDTENLSVVSKWWASANEALELHRRRLATPAAPSQPVNRPQNCGTSFCSCIECVCEPEPVTLTDAVKALDDLQSAFMSHTQWNGTPPSEVIAARAIIAALREKE